MYTHTFSSVLNLSDFTNMNSATKYLHIYITFNNFRFWENAFSLILTESYPQNIINRTRYWSVVAERCIGLKFWGQFHRAA